MKSNKQRKGLLDEQEMDRQGRIAFFVLLIAMAVYYGYRMFALTPWYDELYTYYYFISNGPVYAAIHWPLPNNHVGYSVLSACLDLLGNSYIGLRGISYLCALANLCLLYEIIGKYKKGFWPLAGVILYVSMNLVNQLAVQGRGYTLGITCYLTAWLCMIFICREGKTPKRYYVIYTAALILGLYAVSSNVYWVVPLCFSGGIYLLVKGIWEGKEAESRKKLFQLVVACVVAALGTIFLYTTIWLAIGSNLLVKDVASIYYGMGHVKMILNAPLAAIGRGMEYMLDTPYIQSEVRAGFTGRLLEWMGNLFHYYYGSLSGAIAVVWGVGLLFLVWKIRQGITRRENQTLSSFENQAMDGELLLYLCLFMGSFLVPICLLIQCKRPYYRVFAYGGVLLAILLVVLIQYILDRVCAQIKEQGKRKRISFLVLLLIGIFGVKCLFFSGYNAQYGDREHEIEEALSKANINKWENFCVTDCNQQYLLYFLYGIRCENTEIEGADVVLLDKRMMEPDFNQMVWEFYHYYDSIPWEYMEQNMSKTYENDDYVLYVKNDEAIYK
ncbi:glycosyltransferase family 39 protein [Parablautia muri]|uniref:Glycosyltransferase RgtA/B/C/D-like domain-containing protein n=1 Tax=Parablautia muri TaxID=2320879 RepID=A0A9X5GQE1_9FIRM|nr:glycosyltransferase family 39 protein [Parablautia muri]NBJ92123.1 hypothetical protein [Parablautia muri]